MLRDTQSSRDVTCEPAGRKTSRANVERELLAHVYDPHLADEPGLRHLAVTLGHAGDCIAEVVYFVQDARRGLCRLHAYPVSRSLGKPPYGLEHGIQDCPGKVLFGVGQEGRVVRAGSPAHRQVTLPLQVRYERTPLPGRAALDEVAGRRGDQVIVLSDEQLLPLGELGSLAHGVPVWPESY